MFVLRSTHDAAMGQLEAARQQWADRAIAAEGELAKRKAHAISNLRQNRRKTKKDFAAVIPLG